MRVRSRGTHGEASPNGACPSEHEGNASRARILIVDDDADLGNTLSSGLALAGYRCELASNGRAALDEMEQIRFDAVVSDLIMEGMSGIELLETLRRQKPHVPVIVVSGFAGASAHDVMAKGAFHYLTKPFAIEQLRGVIQQALSDRGNGERTPRGPPTQPERTSGVTLSSALQDVLLPAGSTARALLSRIELYASAPNPVLIRGESGTGKELVARTLHARGPRARAPFVALNTAAIPEHLLESELFGHVRGAFSGASQARRGLLLEANHGTLLLDEIGDMPLALQAKLLRAIQFGEVRPVGSDRAQCVDVRFLAATHRDLRAMAAAGKFRADLYFRLSVLELVVPPLRERRSEIPELIDHFILRARERNPNVVVRSLAPAALEALVAAPWVGNIRELASAVERLAVLCQSSTVTLSDLDLANVSSSEVRSSEGALATTTSGDCLERAQRGAWTIDELTQHYLDRILAQVAGDKAEAARILGIDVSTLYRWLQKRS